MVYISITLFFKPKMDLISTIIVFDFLEIQSNNVPVDDKPYQDMIKRVKIISSFLVVCRKLGCAFFLGVL